MRVERLEIAGFKSFADPVTVSFPGGATAVVGPNGCGKSNIADAIFWVLGELGARTIRARGEDLIFSGNRNRDPLGLAEVRLHVSGLERAPSGSEEPEGGTVVVGRRVDRTGQSVYEIGGRRASRKEILRLFAGTGLGGRSYALIEQGRMGEVLSRPPEELRRFVEEAAGLGRYRQNRRESEENLRAAERALAQVKRQMSELDTRIRQLRRESRQAAKARRLGGEVRDLEIAEQAARREELERRRSGNERRLARLEEEASRRRESLRVFGQRIEEARHLREAAASDLRAITRRMGEARRAKGESAALLAEGERSSRARQARRERLDADVAALRSRAAERREEQRGRDQRLQSLGETARDSAAAARKQRLALEAAREQVNDREKALEAARNQELGKRGALRELEFRVDQHERREEGLLAARQRLEVERQELGTRLKAAGERARETAREQATAEEQGLELEERRRVAERREAERRESLEAARERDSEAEKALARLRARLESASSLVVSREQLGPATRALLDRAGREGLDLPGAVGEGLLVEEGYERATERILAVHRIRVRRASDVAALLRFAEELEPGPWEVQVGEFVERSPAPAAPPEIEGERLRKRVRSQDPQLAAAIPDAVIVPDLGEALAAYARAPGHYVTPNGDSVSPPGVVRVGRGGPGEGFLAARRDVERLQEEEKEQSRLAEEGARAFREAAEAATEATREREQLAEASGAMERRRESLQLRREQESRGLGEAERQLAGVEASLSGNGEDRERNRKALEQALRDAAEAREELAEHGKQLDEAREAAARSRALSTEAEAVWEEAEKEANRSRSAAEAAEREQETAERQEIQDKARLEQLLAERSDLISEDEAWLERRTEAAASSRAAAAEEAGLTARETELVTEEQELSSRVATGEALLARRRSELGDVEGTCSSIRAAEEEVGRSLLELEEEFQRRYGKSVSDAARDLPADVSGRPRAVLLEELDRARQAAQAIGPVNETAGMRLSELVAERERPAAELEDVENGVRDGMKALARHDRDARRRFRVAFEAVDRNFTEAFQQLFGGGRASLRLTGPPPEEDGGGTVEDGESGDGIPADLTAGVEILAEPPGKKLRGVRLLSGGERAMTAIAFLLALFRYRPAPFCLLDEADAALDDQNVERFASLLANLRQTTQLVVITHNRHTMESCDHLYGVTMEEPGVSRVVSLKLDDALSSEWLPDASPEASESLPA